MKEIKAIIRPEKFYDVKNALQSAGFVSMTVTDVKGGGIQHGIVQQWLSEEYELELIPKVKIEICCKDSDYKKITEIIIQNSRTGKMGDGKIFISNIDEVLRIRTGEMDQNAL
jgi:nitrogen regulatory protein P-II 1